jgi:hypothetical protein
LDSFKDLSIHNDRQREAKHLQSAKYKFTSSNITRKTFAFDACKGVKCMISGLQAPINTIGGRFLCEMTAEKEKLFCKYATLILLYFYRVVDSFLISFFKAFPCVGRQVKPLVPAAISVVNTHQSVLGPHCGFWLVLLV